MLHASAFVTSLKLSWLITVSSSGWHWHTHTHRTLYTGRVVVRQLELGLWCTCTQSCVFCPLLPPNTHSLPSSPSPLHSWRTSYWTVMVTSKWLTLVCVRRKLHTGPPPGHSVAHLNTLRRRWGFPCQFPFINAACPQHCPLWCCVRVMCVCV